MYTCQSAKAVCDKATRAKNEAFRPSEEKSFPAAELSLRHKSSPPSKIDSAGANQSRMERRTRDRPKGKYGKLDAC